MQKYLKKQPVIICSKVTAIIIIIIIIRYQSNPVQSKLFTTVNKQNGGLVVVFFQRVRQSVSCLRAQYWKRRRKTALLPYSYPFVIIVVSLSII